MPAVPQNNRVISYTAVGGETVLNYNFRIYSASGLAVDLTRGLTTVTLSNITNYNIAGIGASNGGTITLVIPALAGDVYTLYGVGETRDAEYSQSGPFYASAVNQDMNNAIQISQQLRRDVNRKIGTSVADTSGGGLTIPDALTRANKYMYFDNAGNLMAGIAPGVLTNQTTSVDNQLVVWDGTTGKNVKSNTSSGIPLLNNGVVNTAQQGTDYYAPGGTDVRVVDGGTGSSTAAGARTNLGLGSIATQNAASVDITGTVNITGGSVSGITLGVPYGGTGANNTAGARSNLGLGTYATQAASTTTGMISQTALGSYTGRIITGTNGVAVSNGDGIVGNPTLSVDITSLTNDGTPDANTDYVMTYDASASTNKKVLIANLPGGGSGGGGAPIGASYIVQTPAGTLTNEQALSDLSTGIMKSTSGTGVVSIATPNTDYYAPSVSTIPILDGGTGATTASSARTNLGLGTYATQTAPTGTGIIAQTSAGTYAARTITGGTGAIVTNGDGVSGNPTIVPDINGLTSDATPDANADYVMTYDASATGLKKVLLSSLPSGSSTAMTMTITQAAHGFVVGNVLKYTGSAYALAQANSALNAVVVGIVTAVTNINTFVMSMGGYINTLSGLTAGTTYFLSPTTAGTLTAIEPTTTGQISKPLLIASAATAGYMFNMRGISVSPPAAASGMTLIASATASNSASVVFTGLTSTYYAYKLIISNMTPATSGTVLTLQTSSNNGVSYDGGSSYMWHYLYMDQTTFNYTTNDPAPSIYLGQSWSNTLAGDSEIDLINPFSTSTNKNIFFKSRYISSGGNYELINGMGTRKNTSNVINAFQILMSSGNITSGTFKLYGLIA